MSTDKKTFSRAAPKNYLVQEAAEYLHNRGLTIQDFGEGGVVAHQSKDMLWGLRGSKGVFNPIIPEGWAFRIRNEEGDWLDTFRMRVCNIPEDRAVYQLPPKEEPDRGAKKLDSYPKFIDVGPDAGAPHWTTTLSELRAAPAVMLHEKITSATLAYKLLGLPSVAVSGCWGWSSGRKPRKDFLKFVDSLTRGAKLYVCFDRDMLLDGGPRAAAKSLAYELDKLRPDLVVKFLEVPEVNGKKDGWDDWVAHKGPVEATLEWFKILEADGLELGAPHEAYIDTYKLTYTTNKEGVRKAESTQENYIRLLQHRKWQNVVFDISSRYYDIHAMSTYRGIEEFLLDVRSWLQAEVWPGMSMSIKEGELKGAIKTVVERQRVCSVALKLLDDQPPVGEDEYLSAARDALTYGVSFQGPGDLDTAAITLGRMARDLCYLWSEDHCSHIEWIHVISGIQGCGKTTFWKNLLSCLKEWGLKHEPVAIMARAAKEDDIYRLVRDNMLVTFDEWDKMDRKDNDKMHRMLYDLGTMRSGSGVEKFVERATDFTRRAALCVSVPEDGIGSFLTKGRNTGERRFEIWQIKGVVQDQRGIMLPDWEKLKAFGAILMRYGYGLFKDGDRSSALINNMQHIENFRADSWAADDIRDCNTSNESLNNTLKMFEEWLLQCPLKEQSRAFVLGNGIRALQGGRGANLPHKLRDSYRDLFVECGARYHSGNMRIGEHFMRNVILVNDAKNFMERLKNSV